MEKIRYYSGNRKYSVLPEQSRPMPGCDNTSLSHNLLIAPAFTAPLLPAVCPSV